MFECPHCGEDVPDDAKACPHCGSDDETGWRGDIEYHSVEIPDWLPDDIDKPRQRLSASGRTFLCAIAVLAGLVMLTVPSKTAAQPIFALVLIVSGLYGILSPPKPESG